MAHVASFNANLDKLKKLSAETIIDIFKSSGINLSPEVKQKINNKIQKSFLKLEANVKEASQLILENFKTNIINNRLYSTSRSHGLGFTGKLKRAIADSSYVIIDNDTNTISVKLGEVSYLDMATSIPGYNLGYWRYFEFGAAARTVDPGSKITDANYSDQKGGAAPGYRFLPKEYLGDRFTPDRVPGNGISEGIMVPSSNAALDHKGVLPSRPIRDTAEKMSEEWKRLIIDGIRRSFK